MPETYPDICFYLSKTATNSNDVICLADLAVNLDTNTLKSIIENIDTFWRSTFLKSLFDSLNEKIRTINNDAYLLGQQPNFTHIVEQCKIIAHLMDNSTCLHSHDYRQILRGLSELPRQIACFEQIAVNSLDKILNIGFIKALVVHFFAYFY